MHDDDPDTVKRMLSYLYTLDYSDERLPDDSIETVVAATLRPHIRHKTKSVAAGGIRSGGPSLGAESETLYDPRMMNNVLVYAIAEKYGIPELKDLAKRKFQTLASSKWPHDDFHAVTEAIFSTTPDSDMGLRQIVMDICAEHFQDVLKDEESKAAFLDNKDITATVLDATVRKNEQDKKLLDEGTAKRIALEDELSKARSTIRRLGQSSARETVLEAKLSKLEAKFLKAQKDKQTAVNQKNDLFSRLYGMVLHFNNWQRCQGCGVGFASWIQQVGDSTDNRFQLCCRNCCCSHGL